MSLGWISWSLLSAFFAAVTAIFAKQGIAHIDSNLATAIRTTVVVALAWLIVLTLGKPHEVAMVDRRSLVLLTLSGVGTGLSWLCYFRALSLGPASRVAPLDKLSVVFVLLLAWPILGERLSAGKVAGACLITGGAIVLALTK